MANPSKEEWDTYFRERYERGLRYELETYGLCLAEAGTIFDALVDNLDGRLTSKEILALKRIRAECDWE